MGVLRGVVLRMDNFYAWICTSLWLNDTFYQLFIFQDVFLVIERHKRTGARRQLFLLDQRLIITKERDADGLFVFKDSLKVHRISVAEKQGDNPNRFAVGTGTVGEWDQYYLLEANTYERKMEWVHALKDLMKGQFELLSGQ